MTPYTSHEMMADLSPLNLTQLIVPSCPLRTRNGWSMVQSCPFDSDRPQTYKMWSSEAQMTISSPRDVDSGEATGLVTNIPIVEIGSIQQDFASAGRLLSGRDVELRIIAGEEETSSRTVKTRNFRSVKSYKIAKFPGWVYKIAIISKTKRNWTLGMVGLVF